MQMCCICDDYEADDEHNGEPMCRICAANLAAYDRHTQPTERRDTFTIESFAATAGKHDGHTP